MACDLCIAKTGRDRFKVCSVKPGLWLCFLLSGTAMHDDRAECELDSICSLRLILY